VKSDSWRGEGVSCPGREGQLDDRATRAEAAVELLGPLLSTLVAEAVAVVGPDHAAVTRLVTARLGRGRPEDVVALGAVRVLKQFDLGSKMRDEGWVPEARYPGGWRPPEGG
jgi:hypothetical protein